MRLMNDLGYGQLLNHDLSHKLVLMHEKIIENSFNISPTLAKDFIVYHSLSHSPPQIERANNHILTT